MTTQKFKTYWHVDGIKVNNYNIMRKRVLAGATAIEVTAASQEEAANERKHRARENSIKGAEIRRAAAQRAHERSPDGLQQQAIRTAGQNPGGVVSCGVDPFEELEEFSPEKTNLLR